MNDSTERITSRSEPAAGAHPAPWPEIVAFSGGRNGVNSLRVRLELGAEETLFIREPTGAEMQAAVNKAADAIAKSGAGAVSVGSVYAPVAALREALHDPAAPVVIDTDAPGWFGDCEYRIKPEVQS